MVELALATTMPRGKTTVCCKRVSGHIRACGRAVIIIPYSIILPQHILYNLNITWINHRQDADINLGN